MRIAPDLKDIKKENKLDSEFIVKILKKALMEAENQNITNLVISYETKDKFQTLDHLVENRDSFVGMIETLKLRILLEQYE